MRGSAPNESPTDSFHSAAGSFVARSRLLAIATVAVASGRNEAEAGWGHVEGLLNGRKIWDED